MAKKRGTSSRTSKGSSSTNGKKPSSVTASAPTSKTRSKSKPKSKGNQGGSEIEPSASLSTGGLSAAEEKLLMELSAKRKANRAAALQEQQDERKPY